MATPAAPAKPIEPKFVPRERWKEDLKTRIPEPIGELQYPIGGEQWHKVWSYMDIPSDHAFRVMDLVLHFDSPEGREEPWRDTFPKHLEVLSLVVKEKVKAKGPDGRPATSLPMEELRDEGPKLVAYLVAQVTTLFRVDEEKQPGAAGAAQDPPKADEAASS